ncbi:Synaptic vesicle glycoprotein 2A [Camponotus floridanus]|uniref:Synaptic vesicle glycoprotein 2A n=2 Tax=Camponotus floridanus TaxID=104421 RepID=E2A2X4_CAMFO|nr:Synaptic vesicle glycoprotein 2A [Camponotus floridanus]
MASPDDFPVSLREGKTTCPGRGASGPPCTFDTAPTSPTYARVERAPPSVRRIIDRTPRPLAAPGGREGKLDGFAVVEYMQSMPYRQARESSRLKSNQRLSSDEAESSPRDQDAAAQKSTANEYYAMSNNNTSNIDVSEEKKIQQRNSIVIEDVPNAKMADFETAISAAGIGKFQYLLIIGIIPISWGSSIDTANMSMILPSVGCDLRLSLFDKGLLNAIIYVGMVLSGFMWGYLADVKGRKKIILYGYLADSICNILAGFSQNFETLVFFKFLSGFLVSGPHATLLAYCSEFFGDKGRAKIPLIVSVSVSFGCVVNAVFAWLVIPQPWSIVLGDGAFVYNSWRIYLSICGLPMLIGTVCFCFFPESPKFLMAQNCNKAALEIFRKIYSINTGLPKDNYPIHALKDINLNNTLERSHSHTSKSQNKTKSLKDGIQQMKPMFLNPYLPRILLLITIQFGAMLYTSQIRAKAHKPQP